MIYDWCTGSGHYEFAGSVSIFWLSFLMCFFGVPIFLYNLKHEFANEKKKRRYYLLSSLYALIYSILLSVLLYGYSYLYLFPKIIKESNKAKAIITETKKRLSVDHYGIVIDYEYTVNDKTYKRTIHDDNGTFKSDTIIILYCKDKPNFHVIKNYSFWGKVKKQWK